MGALKTTSQYKVKTCKYFIEDYAEGDSINPEGSGSGVGPTRRKDGRGEDGCGTPPCFFKDSQFFVWALSEINLGVLIQRRWNGNLCQCNYIYEFGEPFKQAIYCFFSLDCVLDRSLRLLCRVVYSSHIEGADEDRVAHGDDSAFRTAVRRDSPKQGGEIGAFGVGCRPSCLSQRYTQPAISFSCLARFALPALS